jgi:glycosyltransferase involved in cell wall biosynthesis
VEADAARSTSARWLTRLAARGCTRVIAVSDFAAAQARAFGVPAARIVTVLNAASVHAGGGEGPTLPPRRPGALVLLVACAAIRRHKGVHVAVEALRWLPGCVLWITGDPDEDVAAEYVRELRALAEAVGARDRVQFLGARRDVHRVMRAADLVLVPSVWDEPCGLVAEEAQLVGVPVVASDRGALPELMGGGALGTVCRAGEPAALAAVVERLAADPARRAGLAETARLRAEERYSYARWTGEVAEALAQAAARTLTGAPGCPPRRLAPTPPP